MTDVTGFALAGHVLEVARGAHCDVHLDWSAVPLMPGVQPFAARGIITGASARNWASYGSEVVLPPSFSDENRALLTDPQTSGGLLVSCSAATLEEVLTVFRHHGFEEARQIGTIGSLSTDPRLLVH
jgi:selenide,water dikinase